MYVKSVVGSESVKLCIAGNFHGVPNFDVFMVQLETKPMKLQPLDLLRWTGLFSCSCRFYFILFLLLFMYSGRNKIQNLKPQKSKGDVIWLHHQL